MPPSHHPHAPPPGPSPRIGRGWRSWLRHLPAILGVLLLFGAVYVVQREFRALHVGDIRHALHAIPVRSLLASFACAVAAYGILTFYDRLGTIYAGHPVSHRRAAFASFCAYALSHNLGFAAVSGAAVRYRLYSHWGLGPVAIGKIVAFCSLTFGLGGLVLGGGVLFVDPRAVPYFGAHLPHWLLVAIGAGLWGLAAAYVGLAARAPVMRVFGRMIEIPHWRMALAQLLLATIDVSVTAAIVYALLPHINGLNYVRLLAVYVMSYSAGLAASLPGGIGVFDGALLFGLSPYLPAPTIIGAILVFRLYYYIIPLFLAGGLFAGNEILMSGRGLLRRTQAPRAATAAGPGAAGAADAAAAAGAAGAAVGVGAVVAGGGPHGHWSEPDFAVAAGAGAVGLCGVMLMSLGVLEPRPDFSWIDPDFAGIATQAGEFVPSLIGAALLVLAASMSRRVRLAWTATVSLLLLAAAFIAVQGSPLWVTGVLLLTALLLAPYRTAFYRHARLLTVSLGRGMGLPVVALMTGVVVLAVTERHVRWMGNDSFIEVITAPGVANSLRASVALATTLALTALWRMLRPGRVGWMRWEDRGRLAYERLGGPEPGRADGLVWGVEGLACVPFRRTERVLLALGDPVGASLDSISAVWRLRDLARQEGRQPAIWSAGTALLDVYAAMGLTALPLDAKGGLVETGPEDWDQPPRFLVCVADRDLPALLKLLPELGRDAAAKTPPPPRETLKLQTA